MSYIHESQSQTPSPASVSPSLPPVQEQDEWNGSNEGFPSPPSASTDLHQRSVRSLPTEYGRAFRTGLNPRPRKTVNSWQARNLSNIIPTGSEGPVTPQRPLRRPPPLATQQARSQVFPEAPIVGGGNADVNNNPEIIGPPIHIRGRRTWPWQARAQTSSIFTGEPATTPTNRTRVRSGVSRWPWQERAKKSVIFDLLSSKDPVKPVARPRTYQWDQRKSTLNISNIGGDLPSTAPSKTTQASTTSPTPIPAVKQWPWQERAMQSVIFRSPDKPNCSHQIKFAWDQRRTRFSVQLDPEAKFAKGSHYNENFPKWQTVQDETVKPAGKPCYTDDNTGGEEKRLGKRRNLPKSSPTSVKGKRKVEEVLMALSSPLPQKDSAAALPLSKVKGTTCLEVVPADYKFD